MATATPERLTALQQAIERESAAFTALLDLLKQEQNTLIATRPDGLEAIVATKNRTLDTLLVHGRDRMQAMAALGLPRDADRAEERLAPQRELAAAFRRLRALAKDSSALNTLNGRLANQRLQFVSARLDTLRGAARRSGTYDATGRAGDSGASGRVIAAA
jgi:flagellar biosynthesis/type III secretory pathway chaperone